MVGVIRGPQVTSGGSDPGGRGHKRTQGDTGPGLAILLAGQARLSVSI